MRSKIISQLKTIDQLAIQNSLLLYVCMCCYYCFCHAFIVWHVIIYGFQTEQPAIFLSYCGVFCEMPAKSCNEIRREMKEKFWYFGQNHHQLRLRGQHNQQRKLRTRSSVSLKWKDVYNNVPDIHSTEIIDQLQTHTHARKYTPGACMSAPVVIL